MRISLHRRRGRSSIRTRARGYEGPPAATGAAVLGAALLAFGCGAAETSPGDAGAEAGAAPQAVRPEATSVVAASHEGAMPLDSTTIVVYKSPTCACCAAWVDHLRESGFQVVAVDTSDVQSVKDRYGVAQRLSACHTATVGDYVIEGHVPASTIRRLLAERPDFKGLAVPGMPMGSPGMEGPRKDPYDVLGLRHDNGVEVYERH